MSCRLCVSGSNKNAQLGIKVELSYKGVETKFNKLQEVDVGPHTNGQPIIHLECSELTTMFLTKDRRVWYWFHKNIFDSFNKPNSFEVPKEMSDLAKYRVIYFTSGSRHTMFLTETHDVLAGGSNQSQQLGLPTTCTSSDKPVLLDRSLFDQQNVTHIVCGARFTYFLTENDVYCCGENLQGQLFLPNSAAQEIHKLPRESYNNERIIDVACGNIFAIMLSEKGNVFVSQDVPIPNINTNIVKKNYYDPTMIDRSLFDGHKIVQISAGYHHCVLMTEIGTCYSFISKMAYSENFGQAGQPLENGLLVKPAELFDYKNRTITKVVCSKNNTAFITADDCIYACGANGSGTLAQGHDLFKVNEPSPVKNSFLLINSSGKNFNVSFGNEHMVIFFTVKNTPITKIFRNLQSPHYSDITFHNCTLE
jgi:alpha-tubulin suppressor-like RCC1 family protein